MLEDRAVLPILPQDKLGRKVTGLLHSACRTPQSAGQTGLCQRDLRELATGKCTLSSMIIVLEVYTTRVKHPGTRAF